jgi:uncharacterized protein with HEPN domain
MGNDLVYLHHIIDALDKIATYLKGKTETDLFREDMLLDAVVRELEIIGEAANNISTEFQKKNAAIPWPSMTGMRNRLIHEYFGVDKKVVWNTCQTDLPELKKLISSLL